MLSVWANGTKELINSVQVIQNKIARIVARNSWDTSNKDNFQQIGWLSVHQLYFYQIVIQMHKIKTQKNPTNLYNLFDWTYSYQTRQATCDVIKPLGVAKSELGRGSFRWKYAEFYNSFPLSISSVEDIQRFKRAAKLWIRDNISFKP